MAQFRSSRTQPFSADCLQMKSPSMLYSILPSAIQSRLPRIPSLRRSVSMYGLPSRNKSAPGLSMSSGSVTPEADDKNAMVLSGGISGHDIDMAGYTMESASVSSDEDGCTTPGLEMGKMGQNRSGSSESRSGIEWKFANQGFNLLSLAVEESSTLSQGSRFVNASFARQLYLHALTYLLQALPSDLTTEERLGIRSALPPFIVEPLQLLPTFTPELSKSEPSLLHRALASSIIQLFILFQFLLPYFKTLLTSAYQYDREHKISEKIIVQGIETVDKVGKSGLVLGSTVLGMGDGKLGQVVGEAVTWFVEGVTGGIHEGVGEGMGILGVGKGERA